MDSEDLTPSIAADATARTEPIGQTSPDATLLARVQAEAALREELYRAVIETSADGFWLVDAAGRILEVNDAYVRRSGYAREELVAMRIGDLEAKESPADTAAHIRKIVREGSDIFDTLHRAKDGTQWAVEVNASYLPLGDGRFCCFLRDVARRRRGDVLLRTRFELAAIAETGTDEELLQHALDTAELLTGSSVGFFHFVDEDQEHLLFQAWSTNTVKAMCRVAGQGRHFPISKAGAWGDCFRTNGPVVHNDFAALPHRTGLPEGHPAIARELVVPVSRGGKVVAIAAVANKRADYGQEDVDIVLEIATLVMDFVLRNQAEERLRKSEERFQQMFEKHDAVMLLVEPDSGRIAAANEAARQFYGYPLETLTQMTIRQIIALPPEEVAGHRRRAAQERDNSCVFPHRISDGSVKIVEVHSSPIDIGGKTILFSVIHDVTDRVRAEQERRRLTVAIEQAAEIVVVTAADGTIHYVNPMFETVTGYTRAEVVGRKPSVLKSGEQDDAFYRGLWETITSGRVWQGRLVNRKKDGSLYSEEATISPVRDDAGRIVSYVAVKRDITEQLRVVAEKARLEEQLRHSLKMESVGTLAGGVAHDFNNILSAIVGYGYLIQTKLDKSDPLRPYLEQMLEAANRGAALTKDLLLFSRKQPINRKPIDLNEGIRRLSLFLKRVIGEDVVCKVQLSAGAIPVLADEHQISQVLMNLATNARDAMPGGGVFAIATGTAAVDEGFVAAHRCGRPGRYALITVSDTGCGMSAQTRERIFEPFFTTKEQGKGTGLGMAVVYGIVTQHDGFVTVESEPGAGATFRVYLPALASEYLEAQSAVESPQPGGGSETILLAEDELVVREMTRELLRGVGYTVITAVDGDDAIEKFREHGDRIHLLLFDLVMPNRSGKDAYDEIRRTAPGIKVIFTSGYDPDTMRQRALSELGIPVIRKPARMASLLEQVRSTLDS